MVFGALPILAVWGLGESVGYTNRSFAYGSEAGRRARVGSKDVRSGTLNVKRSQWYAVGNHWWWGHGSPRSVLKCCIGCLFLIGSRPRPILIRTRRLSCHGEVLEHGMETSRHIILTFLIYSSCSSSVKVKITFCGLIPSNSLKTNSET